MARLLRDAFSYFDVSVLAEIQGWVEGRVTSFALSAERSFSISETQADSNSVLLFDVATESNLAGRPIWASLDELDFTLGTPPPFGAGGPPPAQAPDGSTALFSFDLSLTSVDGFSFGNEVTLEAGVYLLSLPTVTNSQNENGAGLGVDNAAGESIFFQRFDDRSAPYLIVPETGSYTIDLFDADANEVETLEFHALPEFDAGTEDYLYTVDPDTGLYDQASTYGPLTGLSTVLFYTFNDDPEDGSYFYGAEAETFVALTAEQQDALREIFAQVSERIGITFIELPDDSEIMPNMIIDGNTSIEEAGAYASYLSPGFSGTMTFAIYDFIDLGISRRTMWHELGHALNLKHPFDGEGDRSIDNDVFDDFYFDNAIYTAMSYNRTSNAFDQRDALGFGPLDWIALETLYGLAGDSAQYALSVDGTEMIVTGTDGADRIAGSTMFDRIEGGAGDDVIIDESREGYIDGGDGNDWLKGSGQLLGGAGDDVFGATYWADGTVLDGGEGFDIIQGGDTRFDALNFYETSGVQLISIEAIQGGAADDYAYVTGFEGPVRGGDGDDSFYSGGIAVEFYGEGGHDRLQGSSGDDRLDGGDGDDYLDGFTGADEYFGGAGNDFIRMWYGDDVANGGVGADIFSLSQGSFGARVIMDFDVARDRLELFADPFAIRSLSDFDFDMAQDGNDVLITFESWSTLRLVGVDLNALTLDNFRLNGQNDNGVGPFGGDSVIRVGSYFDEKYGGTPAQDEDGSDDDVFADADDSADETPGFAVEDFSEDGFPPDLGDLPYDGWSPFFHPGDMTDTLPAGLDAGDFVFLEWAQIDLIVGWNWV